MKNYKAILFHPEGDFVTDFRDRNNVQDVWEEVADMGSRWIFYPIPFVATDKTVVDVPEGMDFLKGKRIKTVVNFFKKEWELRKEDICDMFNDGWQIKDIYIPKNYPL